MQMKYERYQERGANVEEQRYIYIVRRKNDTLYALAARAR